MRKRNLRLVLALLCIPVLAVTPALAGGSGAAAPGSVGGSGNESATNWFVELGSAPAVKGTSKAKLKAERDAFKANAAAEGVKVSERFAYDSLWNGMSVSVAPSKIAALRSISGVKAIYPVHTVSLPDLRSEGGGGANLDMKNAVGLTGADIAQNELGIDGSGVTIAIMDSGLDWTLPEFGNCFGGSNCKVRGGADLVGDTYNATPTSPAFQPVPHPDGNPLPCDPNDADRAEVLGAGTSNAGHGTHVAGIAAADGRGHTGQTVGAAPGARLLAYRVFGCNGSTDTDVMIHAMELALADDADVLNMSIGSAFGNWPQSPEAVAADNLVEAGMVVVASIGNSGVNGGQLWSAGSPGVGRKVIGVASFDNTKATLPAFQVGSQTYTYNRAAGSLVTVPQSGGGELVATGTPTTVNDGCTISGSLAGKIALIRRGTCGFYNKAINAQNAGAIGVVLYNNVTAPVSPTVAPSPPGLPPVHIPVAFVKAADGVDIYNNLAAAHTLTWTGPGARDTARDCRRHLGLQLVRHGRRARPQARHWGPGRADLLDLAAPAVRRTQHDRGDVDGGTARRRARCAHPRREAEQRRTEHGAHPADEHLATERAERRSDRRPRADLATGLGSGAGRTRRANAGMGDAVEVLPRRRRRRVGAVDCLKRGRDGNRLRPVP